MATLQQPQQRGPPYISPYASMGGLPLLNPDIPISAVLLFIFVLSAATHMTIFQINRRREHKFLFSAMFFGFSIARIAALTMRIVWATRPHNTSIAIAANILSQAGVVVIFVINLFFTNRILRAYYPKFGWNPIVRTIFKILVALVILCLVMSIIVGVHMLYTLDTNARHIDRDVQLVGQTFLAVLAFLPAPITVAIIMWPRPQSHEIKKFGTGRLRTKVRLLLFTCLLLTLGAAWRVATNFAAPPATDPQWYDHKAAYYVLNYGIELIVSFSYAAARFDRRFHVSNRVKKGEPEAQDEKAKTLGKIFSFEVQTEADVFGEDEESGSERARV